MLIRVTFFVIIKFLQLCLYVIYHNKIKEKIQNWRKKEEKDRRLLGA